MSITFTLLNHQHYEQLLRWHNAAHVKRWWDPDIHYTLPLIKKKYASYIEGYQQVDGRKVPIQCFIIKHNQKAIGYIQVYDPRDFSEEISQRFSHISVGAIDIFLGEAPYLNQGLGAMAIEIFAQQYCSMYTHLLVDPDIKNVSAIKCYLRAGFTFLAPQDMQHNPIYMIKALDS